ncbi:acyl-CoA thioesterase [Bordetella genomosp. 2]|uniref:4-hydroxybenzoyl-CoA thioesterase n=1 Tax=Bordetella genomosp. 2 TaxID=1983456 RepID=A0A261VXV6_9BORD|nr:thioesterase family protein [Bordetella genomosp. 2]OZI78849.1 4-hydroxybenzoyl-CoA thioesterase [Bordetella genomosp. 2]
MAAPFASEVEVRFRHCDPAGIVFYPRYFEMINDFVEEWFDKGMDLPFHALHVERQIGTPLVSVQCDFCAPSRWHEKLRQELTVQRIGGASFSAAVRFLGPDGATRLAAALTIVTVDLRNMHSTPLPDDLRQRMQAFLTTG